jgi:hypothetical protein
MGTFYHTVKEAYNTPRGHLRGILKQRDPEAALTSEKIASSLHVLFVKFSYLVVQSKKWLMKYLKMR